MLKKSQTLSKGWWLTNLLLVAEHPGCVIIPIRAVHDPYFTNDPIFRSCALKRASTRILGFADILKFVCKICFP